MQERTFVYLTGGLGNQLFQLASGLANSRGRLEIITYLGTPRLSKSTNPDLLSFELPSGVIIAQNRKKDILSKKITSLLLRLSTKSEVNNPTIFIKVCVVFFAELLLSLKTGSKLKISVSEGLGYSKLGKASRNNLLIGYFQSYRWASESEVLASMKKMKLAIESSEVNLYKNLATIEKPLAVHVRLGDYKNEPTIGILPKVYYEKAINELLGKDEYGSIWIFSDELELAKNVIPETNSLPIRLIPTVNGSSAATLEVMRLCKGYVIANSTFGWWGAFLSYSREPAVIAPKPWFKGMQDPRDLIPPHWLIQET